MNLAEALQNEVKWVKTENGLDALNTTSSALLDFFGNILSYRNKSYSEVAYAFNLAYSEEPLLAMKLLFYIRNIRGLGQGERKTFRNILKFMANTHADVMLKNFDNIPFYGRYDDFYAFVGTPLEEEAFLYLKGAFYRDLNEEDDTKLTLIAKWLKSVNASNPETNRLGRLTASYFGLSNATYRKRLSTLRKRIDIVERKMSAEQFEKIIYPNVPSKAMMIYHDSFLRHDEERFEKYLDDISNSKSKINARALYPYEILRKLRFDYRFDRNGYYYVIEKDDVLEEQWKALPNYVEEPSDSLVVVDTSASMEGLPMSIALSLGVYLAERNKGVWHNRMITFSTLPRFVELKGDSLYEKLNGLPSIVENTDLAKVFDLILRTAVYAGIKNKDMVKRLIVISDMQLNDYMVGTGNSRETFTDKMKAEFKRFGYDLPEIIYWNASPNYSNTYHANKDVKGVKMVSGASPSLFMEILKDEKIDPYEQMLNVLNHETFDRVIV